MADEIRLEPALDGGDDVESDLDAIVDAEKRIREELRKISGEELDLDTEGAEQDIEELVREFKRLSTAFKKASSELDLRRTRNETEKTKESARKLRTAFDRVVDTGKRLQSFAGKLPADFRPAPPSSTRSARRRPAPRRDFSASPRSRADSMACCGRSALSRLASGPSSPRWGSTRYCDSDGRSWSSAATRSPSRCGSMP